MLLRFALGSRANTLHAGIAAVQFTLLGAAFNIGEREAWIACLGAIAVLAFVAWVAALRRRHAITGMPTSRIASAAQGYVELHGVGLPLDVNPLHSPVSGLPCLWYRYRVEERTSQDKWVLLEEATSDVSFVLDDGSGKCVVDPEGAEVLTRHCARWAKDDTRYVEWRLLQHDRVYVLGHFVTLHPGQALDAAADVRELLAHWKQDRVALLRRFDLDGDGQVDVREWELARRLARGQIDRMHRELRQHPELHLVRSAASNSLYLISNHDPEQLARRYLWLMAAQVGGFLAALGFMAWWWGQR